MHGEHFHWSGTLDNKDKLSIGAKYSRKETNRQKYKQTTETYIGNHTNNYTDIKERERCACKEQSLLLDLFKAFD